MSSSDDDSQERFALGFLFALIALVISAVVGEGDGSQWIAILLILGAVRVRRQPLMVAAEVSATPLASHLVRQAPGLELSAGNEATVCNQWHELVALTALERTLLPRLDGAHDHAQLLDHVLTEVRAERLRFFKDQQPVTDGAAVDAIAREQMAVALHQLRRKGLLIA